MELSRCNFPQNINEHGVVRERKLGWELLGENGNQSPIPINFYTMLLSCGQLTKH